MAYSLHIERPESKPISVEEWRATADGDAAFVPHSGEITTPSGEVIKIKVEATYSWKSGPNSERTFDWRRGRISVDRPDDPTIAKMVEIARRLDAQVVGDEGEIYGP